MFLECSRAQTSKDTRNALASTTRLPRLPARLCTCPYSTQGFSSASSCSQAPPLSPRFVSRPAHLQQQLNDGANHQPSHTSRGRNRQPWTSFLIARWLSHPGWTSVSGLYLLQRRVTGAAQQSCFLPLHPEAVLQTSQRTGIYQSQTCHLVAVRPQPTLLRYGTRLISGAHSQGQEPI
jgi:hypothetical protein